MGSADSPSTDRIVAFLPAENDFNSPEALERLKRDNELALALHVEMRKSARELGLSVEDLRKVRRIFTPFALLRRQDGN